VEAHLVERRRERRVGGRVGGGGEVGRGVPGEFPDRVAGCGWSGFGRVVHGGGECACRVKRKEAV